MGCKIFYVHAKIKNNIIFFTVFLRTDKTVVDLFIFKKFHKSYIILMREGQNDLLL